MTDQQPTSTIIEEAQSVWGMKRTPLGCSRCGRVFLAESSNRNAPCPFCRQGTLESQPVRMHPAQPEKILPFKVGRRDLPSICEDFASGVWIKPDDFTAEKLLKRMIPVFMPLWLVDCDIVGHWQIEAGFNYQVESTREYYAGGRWQSRKQIETRVRWEPRLGKITHHVDNVAAPALEEHQNRLKMTKGYHLDQAEEFQPHRAGNALLEVPNLPPEEAWSLAKPKVDQVAAQVCAQAAGADHSRNFALKADYQNLNWTQFYLPLYATYYHDDDGQPQILIVNGETGRIQGPRLASPKRGLRIAGVIAVIAAVLLLLSLIGWLLMTVYSPAGLIAALLGVLGFGAGITALIPAILPSQWNRRQDSPTLTTRRKETQ